VATNFTARDYVEGLQTLLDRHSVGVTVEGFSQRRDFAKFTTPIAEFQIDSLQTSANGALRQLDAVLTAGLLVMVRLDDDQAEEAVLELALDVATALVDELEPGDEPVMPAGPIMVTGIEPEQPDGALLHRVAAYLVTFEQQWRIVRTNAIEEPASLERLYVGRVPDVGTGHEGDYDLAVGELPE